MAFPRRGVIDLPGGNFLQNEKRKKNELVTGLDFSPSKFGLKGVLIGGTYPQYQLPVGLPLIRNLRTRVPPAPLEPTPG